MTIRDRLRIQHGGNAALTNPALTPLCEQACTLLPQCVVWDPAPPKEPIPAGERDGARILSLPGHNKLIVKVKNTRTDEVWFWAIDKCLIPQQPGGQCEGVFLFGQTCLWLEMKMDITTHIKDNFEAKLYEALNQIISTSARLLAGITPLPLQEGVIAVPAKPARLRQSPANFQLKARKTAGFKVYVATEVVIA